jgi:hypothetical protein
MALTGERGCVSTPRSPGADATGRRLQHLGESPIHDLHLAKRPDHDVLRLEVAVDHVASVGVGQRLAHLLEDAQETRLIVHRLGPFEQQVVKRAALDQLHGEEGPAVGQAAEFVDGHDPGVLQLAADLGLFDETVLEVWMTLMASSRPSSGSRPRKTAPMPPRAISLAIG